MATECHPYELGNTMELTNVLAEAEGLLAFDGAEGLVEKGIHIRNKDFCGGNVTSLDITMRLGSTNNLKSGSACVFSGVSSS